LPVFYKHNYNNGIKVLVWHITEPETFFEPEYTLMRHIKHPHKRLQHLAAWHCLQLLLDKPIQRKEILYNPQGKPYLLTGAFQFNLSHANDYAAAIMHSNGYVGIDIEYQTDKAFALRHKFMSPAEAEILAQLGISTEETATMLWSIKESLFKKFEQQSIDFKEVMRLSSIVETAVYDYLIRIYWFETLVTCQAKKIENLWLVYTIPD
jgi:4'-phosphopantetheinyl transferase EntD